jgi:hypothetical protein
MSIITSNELMNSVLGKLYDVLCRGDADVPSATDHFLSWCSPGIPYSAEDLEFISEGLTAGRPPGAATGTIPDTPDAQILRRRFMQAENFARLADMLPDTSGMGGNQTLNIWNPERTLSQVYELVLKMSQVVDHPVDADTAKKLAKFRDLLQVKKTKKDIITDEEFEVTVESPLVAKYSELLAAYEAAVLEYNNLKINAMVSNDPTSVSAFAVNGPTLRNRVKFAMQKWVTEGYKEQYEQIASFIQQTEQRSMTAQKANYLDVLERAKLGGIFSGVDFYYTTLIPGSFAKSNQGWTEFSFFRNDVDNHYDFSQKGGSGKAGLVLGDLNVAANGTHSRTDLSSKVDTSTFSLRFKIAQVPIVRPWFNPSFLVSKYWRFDPNNPAHANEFLCNGESPPQGLLPAYTTTCVFIKDLQLQFGTSQQLVNEVRTHSEGGGAVMWGPFCVGGKYASDGMHRNVHSSIDSQSITVPGMQLIGFKCHVMPKTPAPVGTVWV